MQQKSQLNIYIQLNQSVIDRKNQEKRKSPEKLPQKPKKRSFKRIKKRPDNRAGVVAFSRS